MAGLQIDKTSALLKGVGASKNVLGGLKSFGSLVGAVGVFSTGAEGFIDGNFSVGDFAKIGVSSIVFGLSATFLSPLAVGYGVTDIGFALFTGSSLTDRIGAGIDNLYR